VAGYDARQTRRQGSSYDTGGTESPRKSASGGKSGSLSWITSSISPVASSLNSKRTVRVVLAGASRAAWRYSCSTPLSVGIRRRPNSSRSHGCETARGSQGYLGRVPQTGDGRWVPAFKAPLWTVGHPLQHLALPASRAKVGAVSCLAGNSRRGGVRRWAMTFVPDRVRSVAWPGNSAP
jgi:hypothetical protein